MNLTLIRYNFFSPKEPLNKKETQCVEVYVSFLNL